MTEPARSTPGAFLGELRARLERGAPVKRKLPFGGRIHVDRQLPFLCVYRRPVRHPDPGTERLVTSEAAHVITSGAKRVHPDVADLVRAAAEVSRDAFGAFLLVEIWSAGPAGGDDPELPPAPEFHIRYPRAGEPEDLVSVLTNALSKIRVRRQRALVRSSAARRCAPGSFPELLPPELAAELCATVLGLAVRPVFRSPDGDLYPELLRKFRRGWTRALRQFFYEFSCSRTTQCPIHYHVLGRRDVSRAVWDSDAVLSAAGARFDPILQVTPIDSGRAFREFQEGGFEKRPRFHYRPLSIDPIDLKRSVWSAPVDRVEDPALAQILRQKQEELDRQITLMVDLGTPRFLHGSLQVYGGVEPSLVGLAERILKEVPARTRDDSGCRLSAEEFAALARKEVDHYRSALPALDARVEVRPDLSGGLLVSQGSLLVGAGTQIPERRAEALLSHEVGTHVLTFHNGRAQRLKLLSSGLAGYEALQEGLAVLAEYLVGGLGRPRMRLLAARVLAVRWMIDGARFAETYRRLNEQFGFAQKTAFSITTRTFRGGGLTKDAIYLRGLVEVLEYVREGGALEALFIGKLAAAHIPVVSELRYRGVLQPPPLTPRYMQRPDVAERLQRLRSTTDVLDLIERKRP